MATTLESEMSWKNHLQCLQNQQAKVSSTIINHDKLGSWYHQDVTLFIKMLTKARIKWLVEKHILKRTVCSSKNEIRFYEISSLNQSLYEKAYFCNTEFNNWNHQ